MLNDSKINGNYKVGKIIKLGPPEKAVAENRAITAPPLNKK